MDLSVVEQLCFSTVSIETTSYDGNSFSGTGFFFNLTIDNAIVSLVVTNKHVVADMAKGSFIMSERDKEGNPIYTSHIPVNIEEHF